MTTKNRTEVLSFGLPSSEARKIHEAASGKGMSISDLLRSIVYDRTDGLSQFDVACIIKDGRGRKRVRNFTEE